MYYINNSENSDPYINLALEEYAVRNLDRRKSYVLFYINKPSLIIGKHQNVVEEISLAAAHRLNIPIIRRISGGGTVFHDEGNLNFSFITKHTHKKFNQYSRFLKPIIEILLEFGINAKKDDRNNIIIDQKKVSGNAQFTSRGRLLCHGTLLFNSELEILNEVIKKSSCHIISSKSTKSKRGVVANTSDYLSMPLSINDLRSAMLDKIFNGKVIEYKLSAMDWQNIALLAHEKYGSWEWNYGLSPKSTVRFKINKEEHIIFDLEMGKISAVNISLLINPKNLLDQLQEMFIGRRFDFITLKEILLRIEGKQSFFEITELLKAALNNL